MDDRGSARPRPPVTLKTVADAAGVHASTVSRALRRAGRAGPGASVGDVRLLDLAREMGYVPNPNAASLTTGRAKAFGVLVPQLTESVLATVYDAVEETANHAGYATFVANTRDEPGEQWRQVDLLLGRAVNGLILGDARLDNDNVSRIIERGIDVVLVSRRCPGAVSVTIDDQLGGRLAGDHLAGLGHRSIGVVAGPPWVSTTVERLDGFRIALAKRGVTVPDSMVRHEGFDVASGRRGAERLLAGPEFPTAIFAMNDDAAIGVLGVLRDRGLVAGRDVAVVGYNDIPVSRELYQPLTTVRTSLREMGVRAAQALLALGHGLPTSSVALAPELVVRETTEPTAVDAGPR